MSSGCALAPDVLPFHTPGPIRPIRLPRHNIEPPELTLNRTFFPMGFAVKVRTNDARVFPIIAEMWGRFEPLPAAPPPLRFDIHVVDGDGTTECPPAPVYRLIHPLLMSVADAENYSIVDLATLHTQVSITSATLEYPLYVSWFLFSGPLACISTRYTLPIHGACVTRNGQGVLLCGNSGAGKSTLSYACARAGWQFTSDDATMVLHHDSGRGVIGNCHQMRFRPTASDLFPEIASYELTPRAAGKPSVEIPTSALPHIHTSFHATIDHIVFLDRRAGEAPLLDTYPVDAAREYLRDVLFGPPDSVTQQYEVIERVLTAPLHRLQYERLDDALRLLQQLVEGDAA